MLMRWLNKVVSENTGRHVNLHPLLCQSGCSRSLSLPHGRHRLRREADISQPRDTHLLEISPPALQRVQQPIHRARHRTLVRQHLQLGQKQTSPIPFARSQHTRHKFIRQSTSVCVTQSDMGDLPDTDKELLKRRYGFKTPHQILLREDRPRQGQDTQLTRRARHERDDRPQRHVLRSPIM